jgi:hypothetical protein
MRDERPENRQPDDPRSSAQGGRVSTPNIVGFAFRISLPNAPRFAASFGRLSAPNDGYSPDSRRARYSALATILSKPFQKKLKAETL